MTDILDPAQAWNAVAEAWDTNVEEVDEHSAIATGELLERLAVQPGDRVLELASGPGSLGATWSQLVGPTGSVLVTDLSPAMVEVARRRTASLGNVDTAIVDVATIDQPEASFDVVACRMGLMFTPDPSAAFRSIHRVTRPGGRLGTLTWGGIDRNPWMTCVGMAAMANGLVHGGPPVGPGGIFSLGDPEQLQLLAGRAGFLAVSVEAIPVTFRASTVDEHVARVCSLAGPLARALRTASPDQLAAFRRTAHELAAPYAGDNQLEIPGQALLLSARR